MIQIPDLMHQIEQLRQDFASLSEWLDRHTSIYDEPSARLHSEMAKMTHFIARFRHKLIGNYKPTTTTVVPASSTIAGS
jgi:hypothetical protein